MELALNQHQLKILKFFQEIYLYFDKELNIEDICKEIMVDSKNTLEKINNNEVLNNIFLQKLEKLKYSLPDTSDYSIQLKEILFGFGKLVMHLSSLCKQDKFSSSIVIELLERFEHVLKIYQDTSNVSDESRFLSLLGFLENILVSYQSKLIPETFEALKQKIQESKSRYEITINLVLERIIASFEILSNQTLTKNNVIMFLELLIKRIDDAQKQDDSEKLAELVTFYLKVHTWLANNLNSIDEKIIFLDKRLREDFTLISERFFHQNFTKIHKLPSLGNLKLFKEFVYLSCLPVPKTLNTKISNEERTYIEAWRRCIDSAASQDNNQLDVCQQELLNAFWEWQLKQFEKRRIQKRKPLGSNYWFITENDLSIVAFKGLIGSIEKLLNENVIVSLDKDDDRSHIQIFYNADGKKLLVNNRRGNTRNSLSTQEVAARRTIVKVTEQQGLLAIIQTFIFYATSKNKNYLGENQFINQFFNITNKNFEVILSENRITFRLRAQTSNYIMVDYGAKEQKFFFDISFDVIGSSFNQIENFKFNFATDNKNRIALNPETLKSTKKNRFFSKKNLKNNTDSLPWELLPISPGLNSLTSSSSSDTTTEDEVFNPEVSTQAIHFSVADTDNNLAAELELQKLRKVIQGIQKDKLEKGVLASALNIFATLDEQQKKFGNDAEAVRLISVEKSLIYQELLLNPNSHYVLSQRRTDILLWDDSEGIKRENELAILKDANKKSSKSSGNNRLIGNTPYRNNILNKISNQTEDKHYVKLFIEKKRVNLSRLNNTSIELLIANAVLEREYDTLKQSQSGIKAKDFYRILSEYTKGPKSFLNFMLTTVTNFIRNPGINKLFETYRYWQTCKNAEQLRTEFLDGYGAYIIKKNAQWVNHDSVQTEIQSLQSIKTTNKELEDVKQQIITKLGRKNYSAKRRWALFADAARIKLELAVENESVQNEKAILRKS